MIQVFHHHKLWEDARAGLYSTTSGNEKFHICAAVRLLSDQRLFSKVANEMVLQWMYSAEVNLSNRQRNRLAWIGQASCCFYSGCPEYCTKQAWNMIDEKTQAAANKTATAVLVLWEQRFSERIICQSANLK